MPAPSNPTSRNMPLSAQPVPIVSNPHSVYSGARGATNTSGGPGICSSRSNMGSAPGGQLKPMNVLARYVKSIRFLIFFGKSGF